MRRALALARSTAFLRRLPTATLRRCSGQPCEETDELFPSPNTQSPPRKPELAAACTKNTGADFPEPAGAWKINRTETGAGSPEPAAAWKKNRAETGADFPEPGAAWKKNGIRDEAGTAGPSVPAGKWPGLKRKTAKNSKVLWVCSNCGESFSQWWGTCQSCGEFETIKALQDGKGEGGGRGSRVASRIPGAWLPQGQTASRPQKLSEVNQGINHSEWKIPLSGLFGVEFSRVLGGGLVPGSLVLIGGDPGVGKSTLLLQIAAMLAEGTCGKDPAPVVYVSGEESLEQIGNRASRMRIGTDSLFLYSSTDIEDVLDKVYSLSPRAVIIDSIQTVYLQGVTGSAGSLSQVRDCTSALLCFSKQTNIPMLLIGHVTKTGEIAGPRVLEHIVDTVLYMEGERYSSYRLLRSVKNRFGSTDELGVFEMSEIGLQAVTNPSEIFLSEDYIHSEVLAGLAVAAILDSSRTFLIEIQALCSSNSTVARHYNGVSANRADMIVSVLIKQAGIKLQDNAVFLNVVSGFKLEETAGDLAIAAAICSSFLERPIPKDIAFIGEIGLGGEIRTVPRMDKRLTAISKLGYQKCVIPKSAEKSLEGLDLGKLNIVRCTNLKDVINSVFAE